MRTRSKALLLLLLIVLLASGMGLWFLGTATFQEFARATLRGRLEEATGLECRIENFKLDIFRGHFRLTRLELGPRPGVSGPIRLKIDQVHGSFRWLSLFGLKVRLTEMNLVRPYLALNFTEGPPPISAEQFLKALRRSFEFTAQRISIQDGWMELNNRLTPFDLSLKDVICEILYRDNPLRYLIRLAYRDSHVVWAERDISYDLDARLTVTLEGVDIQSFEVSRSKTLLRGGGLLRDWNSPVILLHGTGKMAAEELALFYPDLKAARGEISVTGNLRWDTQGFRSTGRFSANQGRYHQVSMQEIKGKFEIQNEAFLLREVEGRVGSGKFNGEGLLHLRVQNEPQRLLLSMHGMSVRDGAKVLGFRGLDFENAVDGEGQVRWRQGIEDLEVDGKLQLHGAAEGAKRTPLQGDAEFNYRRGTWYIPRANFHSPQTDIRVSGKDRSTFQVAIATTRPAESLNILRSFSTGVETWLQKYPDLMDLRGLYEIRGETFVKSLSQVSFLGMVKVTGGAWRSYSANTLNAAVSWDGEKLDFGALKIERGREIVEGHFTLIPDPTSGQLPDVSFRGQARQIRVATLKEMGLNLKADVTGTLNGSGELSYIRGVWKGQGEFEVEKGSFYQEPFDSLRARVQLADQQLRIMDAEVARGSGRATFKGQVNVATTEMNISAQVVGFRLQDIPALRQKELAIEGVVTGSAEVRGTSDAPEIKGSFNLADLRYESWQLGAGSGTVDLKNRILQASAIVRSELGAFTVQGRVSTESGFPGKAQLEFADFNVRKVISGSVPSYLQELSTAIAGNVVIEGRFAEPSSLKYQGELDGAQLKIHDFELRNSGKMRFAISGQKLSLDEVKFVGKGSSLVLSGIVPVDNSAALNLRLEGTLDLGFLEHTETKVAVSGSAKLDVRASGTLQNPQIIGQATLDNARLNYQNLPFSLSSVAGDVVFSRNTISLQNVRGNIAAGTLEMSGSLEHQNAELRSLNLQVSARRARLPYPKDFRTTLDADLNLRGSVDAQVLTGDVRVVRAEYIRDFNVLEQFAARTLAPSGPVVTDPTLAGLRLNVSIHSEDGLVMDTELLKLQGRIHLTLRGTPAYPSLTGRVEATEGFIFFRGNRFEVIHASADFVDRNRINPVFDVRAEADVKSYRLLLDVTGDLDNLRSNIRSDPPLPTVDIVSLLTTGKSRVGETTARSQAEITGLSAASILSESLTGVIGKRVERLFGFQSFRVDPFLAGAENDPTARVTISQRLSKDITVTFSRNLSTNEEQIVLIEYDVSKNLSVIATRDEDGKFGLDFRFRRRLR